MSKLAAVVVAAAGLFAAMPAFTSSAQANESVSIRVNDGYGYHHRHHGYAYRGAYACSTKVIWRNGHKTVVKRCN